MTVQRALIEGFLPPGPAADEIAHYTRMETLIHLLGSSGVTSLRATGLRYLNDRRELRHGIQVFRDLRPVARIASILDQLADAPDVYQVSFSGAPDELGQWRGYAANGQGCSLVVDRAAVYGAASVAGWVLYDRASQNAFANNVLLMLKSVFAASQTREIGLHLLIAAAFMKHEGFRPEQEYRLLVVPSDAEAIDVRPAGERIAPFIDVMRPVASAFAAPGSPLRPPPFPLPVRRILVGPGWQLSELSHGDFLRHHVPLGVLRLLERHGLSGIDVRPSGIPYDPR